MAKTEGPLVIALVVHACSPTLLRPTDVLPSLAEQSYLYIGIIYSGLSNSGNYKPTKSKALVNSGFSASNFLPDKLPGVIPRRYRSLVCDVPTSSLYRQHRKQQRWLCNKQRNVSTDSSECDAQNNREKLRCCREPGRAPRQVKRLLILGYYTTAIATLIVKSCIAIPEIEFKEFCNRRNYLGGYHQLSK